MVMSYEQLNTVVPVSVLLESLGARDIKDKGDYLLFRSPFREDKHPSMVLYKNNLFIIDFSGFYKGSIFNFYKFCMGESFFSAYKDLLRNIINNNYFSLSNDRVYKNTYNDSSYKFFIKGQLNYDPFSITEAREYLEKRFITREFVKNFHISYSRSASMIRAHKDSSPDEELYTDYSNRICIPIFYKGNMISVEGRDLRKAFSKVVYPKGGVTSVLFNYDNLDRNKPLIVTEGIMDIPRIWSHITENVTTIFGIQITYEQKRQLKEFEKVILFPDTDDAGEQMVSNFDRFYEDPFWVSFSRKGDPGDPENSIEDLKDSINSCMESTEFFINKSELFKKDYEIEEGWFL